MLLSNTTSNATAVATEVVPYIEKKENPPQILVRRAFGGEAGI